MLAICASFRASSIIGSSGGLIVTAHTSPNLFCPSSSCTCSSHIITNISFLASLQNKRAFKIIYRLWQQTSLKRWFAVAPGITRPLQAPDSGLYEFRSCALCCEVSHRELFAKIPSLTLALEITLIPSIIQPLLKISDHRWGSKQKPIWKLTALRFLKASVSSPQTDKAHTELCLVYQSMYQYFSASLLNSTSKYLNLYTSWSLRFDTKMQRSTGRRNLTRT